MGMSLVKVKIKMTLSYFTISYIKSSFAVDDHYRQYRKLIARMYLSFGATMGLLISNYFLYMEKNLILASLILMNGWLFIYSIIMLSYSHHYKKKNIIPAEHEKFDRWADICDLEFIPVVNKNSVSK